LRKDKRPLIILDLDNTLYDWVEMFVASFYAMVDAAVEILDCDRERLLDDLREVHRTHHDSEHPFALLETPTVLGRFPGLDRAALKLRLDQAFHAFNSARKRTLKEYPGVTEGLTCLKADGFEIAAHTESNAMAAFHRLEKLGLIGFFARVYCREPSNGAHPNPEIGEAFVRRLERHHFVKLRRNQRKPDPDVLREILAAFDVAPGSAVYVGDSLTRDMKMAVDVGVKSIWARYGTRHAPGAYEKLVRVTHWTEEDVVRERALSVAAKLVKPDFVAEKDFSDVVQSIERSQESQRVAPVASGFQ
jgi:FMN phosphatase YigB (HAD superfamily)